MPSPLDYLRLIGLGALIGVPSGLLAAGFLALVHQIEDAIWKPSPEPVAILGLPVAGALIVLAARRLLPGDGGHNPLDGLAATPTPFAYGPGVALAALGTLAFGAVLGPEAPLIALGSVVGMIAARVAGLDERMSAVLSTAGSFSAVSALFGGPLVAGMLLLEAGVAMGRMLIPVLLPGLVAAACGYSVFVGLGDWGGIETQTLSVPGLPAYDGTSVGDLLVAVAVGVVIALVVEMVRKLAVRVHELEGSVLPMPALLIGGGLCVGLLALVADALGAQPNEIFFSGQAAVPELLQETSAGILLVILAAKALAFAVSLGCGFRGGPVFPSIFLGVGIVVLAGLALDLSPTLAVSVGTAAGMAAMTGLLFSSVLFAGLLTGSAGADAIPAAVLAAAAAWVVRTALQRRAGDEEAQPAAGR
jgi:H+/Cl- antiporter ClcA